MKQTMKLVSFMMTLALLFVSCSAPDSSAKEVPDTVNVMFQSLEAKTTVVNSGSVDTIELENVYFQYKAENVSLSDPNGKVIGSTTGWTNFEGGPGLNKVLKLTRGIWNLYLRGFASEAERTAAGTAETENTQAIFAGKSENLSVGNGNTNLTANVDVALEFTNPTGTGSCSVVVSYAEAYASVQNKKAVVKLRCGETYNETVTLTFGVNGTDASDTAEFSNIPNGIATITVDYLDTADGDKPFEDEGSATTLIMTDMHTSASATISMDVVKVTVEGTAPEQSAEEIFGSGS